MSSSFSTKVVHFSNNKSAIKSKTTPIYQTSAFAFRDLEDLESFFQGETNYLYSRVGNPNTDELGHAVATLEGAPAGVAASSGLSAILAGILSVVQHGEHLIAADDIYGGTYHLLAEELKTFGISVSFVSFANKSEIEKAIQPETKLIYTESITNPLLRVEDISEIVSLAKVHNLVTMVDNTFATPFLCQPYNEGVDLVVHSATKYIGGHSDVTAGVLVGNENFITLAKQKVTNLGTNLSPFEAWLTCRGLKTLGLRMERQVNNAQKLAEALSELEGVKKVYYPSTVSEKGNGAIVTIELAESKDISTFFKSLSWVKIIPSLAGVETTVSYPLGTSHRALPAETCENLGITKGLVRISVGIEDIEDIIQVFAEAIK